jgi:L-lactate dehydrogenase (cytochrome)
MIRANVADHRLAARRRLPKVLFDYIDGGSYAEATLAANVSRLEALTLSQRVMVDVSNLSEKVTLFGQTLSMPLVLSPVGLAGMYARRGEVQAARAARAAGVPFSLSTVGVCDIEEVTAGAGVAPWYQLYMIRDRGFTEALLARAEAAGCPALLFTVDLPMAGARYRDIRNEMVARSARAKLRQALDGLTHPAWLWDVYLRGGPHRLGNVAGAARSLTRLADYWAWVGPNLDPSVTWADIAWLRERWKRPIIIKGILDVEDAREAVRCGVDGVVVSNHGGRQLDGVQASIDALPRIADAVGDQTVVLMDGGIRSGLDVLKALASGARACLIGRAWAYALGGDGEAGVAQMLQTLRYELRMAMALTGCTDVTRVPRRRAG